MPGARGVKVFLITDFRGLIPPRIMKWDGYDLGILRSTLENGGADVETVGAHSVSIKDAANIKRCAAIYASSQDDKYRQYIQDVVGNLHFAGVKLFPAFEHMLAHEDKAFQALRLQRTDIPAPSAYVFGDKWNAYKFLEAAAYPLVAKSVSGFGARGVRLINSRREGFEFVDENMEHRALEKGRPFLKKVWHRAFPPSPQLGLVVFQEFLPHLEGDWKVLIWGDHACGVYRKNRDNDFRASGSGKIEFVDIPIAVLDFASSVLARLNLPWASLDIAFTAGQCFLIEYQAVHFGLTAVDKGEFFYVRDSRGIWQKRQGQIETERQMGQIVINSLSDMGWL